MKKRLRTPKTTTSAAAAPILHREAAVWASHSTPPSGTSPEYRSTQATSSPHSARRTYYTPLLPPHTHKPLTPAFQIANTSLIPLITRGVPESERYLLLTRPYYQGLPAEPLLIVIPIAAHIASGLALRIYRRNQNAQRYGDDETKSKKSFFGGEFWPKVSGISKLGYPFIWLLLGHTFINRGIPKQFPGGSSNVNLSYVSHAFARHPAVSFAGFTALLAVGCFHMTWGWAKWLGYTPDQVTVSGSDRQLVRKRRWYVINGLAGAVTALWMAGSFGVIGRGGEAAGWVGRQYNEMYRRIPLVGQWM